MVPNWVLRSPPPVGRNTTWSPSRLHPSKLPWRRPPPEASQTPQRRYQGERGPGLRGAQLGDGRTALRGFDGLRGPPSASPWWQAPAGGLPDAPGGPQRVYQGGRGPGLRGAQLGDGRTALRGFDGAADGAGGRADLADAGRDRPRAGAPRDSHLHRGAVARGSRAGRPPPAGLSLPAPKPFPLVAQARGATPVAPVTLQPCEVTA